MKAVIEKLEQLTRGLRFPVSLVGRDPEIHTPSPTPDFKYLQGGREMPK